MIDISSEPGMRACEPSETVETDVAEYDAGIERKKRERHSDGAVGREHANDDGSRILEYKCAEDDDERQGYRTADRAADKVGKKERKGHVNRFSVANSCAKRAICQKRIRIAGMPPEMTDEEIVRRTLLDKEAFTPLIERYEAKLTRYLERLGVGVHEDCEDILQNAFIKAYRNLNSFDQTLAFSSWMYRIAHNEAMSFFRSRHARPQVVLDEGSETLLTELRDENSDTTHLAELRLSREELAKAFTVLTPLQRDVLTLRFFEDRSYAEISDILEVPTGTVSTLLYRAKRALREALPEPFSL